MTFASDASRAYTLNYINNAWLKTPANLRTQFPPTIKDIEGFIDNAVEERPAIAAAGYPVALLAERGYLVSVALRNGLPVPADEYGDED
jgi:hypothetical protein